MTVLHSRFEQGEALDQRIELLTFQDEEYLITSLFTDDRNGNWHTLYKPKTKEFPVFTFNHAMYWKYYLDQGKLFASKDDLGSENWSFRIAKEYDELDTNCENYITIEEDLFVPGFDNSIGNYFHFFSHILPKIYVYFELKKVIPDLKIYADIYGLPNWKKELYFEVLGLAGEDFFRPPPGMCIRNKKKTLIPSYLHVVNFNPVVKRFYDDRICRPCVTSIDEASCPKKILYLRNSGNAGAGRVITNQSQIVELCSRFGFEELDPGEKKFQEIVSSFYNAESVVMDMGSGVFNLFWCRSGTNAVLLNGPHRVRVSDGNIKGHPLFDFYTKPLVKHIISTCEDSHENDWSFEKFDQLSIALELCANSAGIC